MINKPVQHFFAVTIIIFIILTFPCPPRVLALDTGQTLEVTVLPAAVILGTAAAGYLYYKNRYSQPTNAKGALGYRGPGEFFFGGFLGAGSVANSTWDYRAGGLSTTVSNMKIDPGITGGLKLGYFFDSFPYFGIEGEGSIGTQYQPSQTVNLNPALKYAVAGRVSSQSMLVWTMALHFLGRYGFFPSPEVPFGHLQPYVGIGPGLVVLYAPADSAKNFSLEVEAGLRYMVTKNLGAFIEYKFSQQWQVELEAQQLNFNNFGFTANKAVFDFTRNQVVVGLAYHF